MSGSEESTMVSLKNYWNFSVKISDNLEHQFSKGNIRSSI